MTPALSFVKVEQAAKRHCARPLPWGESWGEGVRRQFCTTPLTRRFAPTSPRRGEVNSHCAAVHSDTSAD